MRKRRTVAWLLAVVVGMMLIPAMDAAASKKSEKKQNARITAVTKATAKVGKRVAALTTTVGDHTKSLAALQTLATGIDGRLKTIEAGVPQVIQGLSDLKDGLLALKAAAEGGFAKVTETFLAVEYGVTRVRTGPGGAGPALPITLTSSDIPDDGNTATAAGEIPISVGPNPGQVPADTVLTAHSAIRSGEADGAATGDPAGYVGGLITMKCGGGLPANGGACDADPTAGTTLVPSGAVLCIVGPPPNQTITVPGTGAGTGPQPFPLVTIQQKAERTDQSKPDASSANPVAGASAALGTVNGPLASDSEDGCKTGDAGNTLLLTVQTQYVDIPTSTTPGNKD